MINLLDGSGGATKGVGIYRSWKTAVQDFGYKFDVISGISVSALISVPFALAKYDELDELMENFDLDYIYDPKPVGDNGKPTGRAIFRLITGKSGLSNMIPIKEALQKLVTRADFLNYKTGDYAPCYVMSVDYKSGKRIFVNLKDVDYDHFIAYSVASASIPVISEPIKIDGMILYDGGVRDHDICYWMIDNFKIKNVFSVWSRPENYNISDPCWEDENVVCVLSRTLDITQVENSKSDQSQMFRSAKENNINLKTVFLPSILNSVFDVDKERLKLLSDYAYNLTRSAFELIKS